MRDPLKPSLRVDKTDTLVYNQGFTYNEVGLSYNNQDVSYGGIYGNNSTSFILNATASTKEPRIDMFISIPILYSILLENRGKLLFEDGGEILS